MRLTLGLASVEQCLREIADDLQMDGTAGAFEVREAADYIAVLIEEHRAVAAVRAFESEIPGPSWGLTVRVDALYAAHRKVEALNSREGITKTPT